MFEATTSLGAHVDQEEVAIVGKPAKKPRADVDHPSCIRHKLLFVHSPRSPPARVAMRDTLLLPLDHALGTDLDWAIDQLVIILSDPPPAVGSEAGGHLPTLRPLDRDAS